LAELWLTASGDPDVITVGFHVVPRVTSRGESRDLVTSHGVVRSRDLMERPNVDTSALTRVTSVE